MSHHYQSSNMRSVVKKFLVTIPFLVGVFFLASSMTPPVTAATEVVPAADVGTSFRYTFNKDGVLSQTTNMNETRSQYWWLSSGGEMLLKGGLGMTLHGEQQEGSDLQVRYEKYNNENSDGGLHPQNIFRLVTRSKWQNFSQEIHARIDKTNLSSSSDRDASDGILLFNRYQDQYTLYYAGVRVDGAAVIKKKYQESYTTLAIKKGFFTNSLGSYNRDTNPNLLPQNTWFGVRSVVKNFSDGRVQIQLYVDRTNSGKWELATEAIDDGSVGGPVIAGEGYGGLRMDYMDVTFDNYYMKTL